MNTPKPPKADLPAEVKAEMARRGWSARELSARTGIKVATLYRRLSGTTDLTISELAAISDALGVPASTLVARAEDVAA